METARISLAVKQNFVLASGYAFSAHARCIEVEQVIPFAYAETFIEMRAANQIIQFVFGHA